jgi:LPS-assembly lipoprotein
VVESFAGWFATATTVATAAAEADARRRLMTMLADRVVARLYAALAA